MIDQLKPLLGKLAIFSQQRMGFKNPPKLFLRKDSANSQQALGKTAFYNPNEQSVTLFIHGRHPKDILRSFAHELVHHTQNERGDLSLDKMGEMGNNYAQENPHMRNMEKEAYLKGNMCFRDWEDEYKLTLKESKFLKESKTMTTKITKEFLKETIRKIISEKISGIEGGKKLANAVFNNDQETLKKFDDNSGKKKVTEEEELEESKCGKRDDSGRKCGNKSCKDCYPVKEELKLEEAKCCGRDNCEHPRDDHLIKETEELEEGKKCPHCDGDAPKSECICGKVEESAKPDYIDIDGDGDKEESMKKAAADKEKQEESKIQTPEQENSLYEQRFAPKNNRLFEKLVKEWTK